MHCASHRSRRLPKGKESPLTDPRWQTLPEATRIRWIRVLDDYNPIALTPLSRIALRTLAMQGNADGLA